MTAPVSRLITCQTDGTLPVLVKSWLDARYAAAGSTSPVSSVAGKTGAVLLNQNDVGLDQVSNTSDATKNSASVALTNKDLTSATNTFPVTGIAKGGTGATTAQGAINTLTGVQTAGRYLRSDGSNAALAAIQAADVPTLNQSTTGNAATATKLATPRAINGVNFDGSAPITVADSTKEPTITAGTGGQFWDGTKTWKTLDKTAVGLGNVDNTADTVKAVASAAKLATARSINGVAFDGTADITITTTGTDPTKEPKITAGDTTQYWRGDKTWQALNAATVGLPNVDNTSDYTKNTAVATLNNKTVIQPRIDYICDTGSGNPTLFLQTNGYGNGVAIASAAYGSPPTIGVNGDANLSLNLVSKGTGTVQANGSPVVTGASSAGAKLSLWSGTQAQYDAIGTKDGNTVYVVT